MRVTRIGTGRAGRVATAAFQDRARDSWRVDAGGDRAGVGEP